MGAREAGDAFLFTIVYVLGRVGSELPRMLARTLLTLPAIWMTGIWLSMATECARLPDGPLHPVGL